MQELKLKVKAYEEAKKRSDAADQAWAEDTAFDEAIEDEWDAAYVEYCKAQTELADELQKLIGVDRGTANVMILTKMDEIKALLARVA